MGRIHPGYGGQLFNADRIDQGRGEPFSYRFQGLLVSGRWQGIPRLCAYASDEAWPNLAEGETRSEYIRYLEIFPYINKPAALSDFKRMGEASILYHIFAPFGFFFLLRLVIRGNRGAKKKQKKATRKTTTAIAPNAPPPIGPGRSEINMFCYNCGNKLPEGALFVPIVARKWGRIRPISVGPAGLKFPGCLFLYQLRAAVNKGETHSIQTRSKGVQARG